MHTYAFGSVCRGETDHGSDIDLLALVEGAEPDLDPDMYSIYSYARTKELWEEGNPFAWHLAKESRLLFASDGKDFLLDLGSPEKYCGADDDCEKFRTLFEKAKSSLETHSRSPVFELSTMFLAVRNFATCYALGRLNVFEFSRSSALRLGDKSLPISDDAFSLLERARILSTRGYGEMIHEEEVGHVLREIQSVSEWMKSLMKET